MKNKQKTPFILIIMDGYGLRKDRHYNAVALAKKPNLDLLKKQGSYTTLKASGTSVGLPKGQIGSSEVNHMNMGAGRIVNQEIVRINKAIKDGSFFKNKILIDAIKNTKGRLHLMGLVSDGGVHSHIRHLFAIIDLAKRLKKKDICIHAFLDGRDVSPRSAKQYIRQLEKKLKGIGQICTLSGRYYSMDRDRRWSREKKAYGAIVNCKGPNFKDATTAIAQSYSKKIYDEFLIPCTIGTYKRPISKNDTVLFFNFRSDRARQLTRAITDKTFSRFKTKDLRGLKFITLTDYDKTLNVKVAFPQDNIKETLAGYLSHLGKRQLHIAETEKYAHVTFFFNGGKEKTFRNEDRILIHSPKVATYDLKPEMSAFKVTKEVIKAIKSRKYDFIVVNLANPDMVGHSGKLKPTIKAVEVTDTCVGKIITEIKKLSGQAIITADHGNAELLRENGKPHTAHTLNPVPMIVLDYKNRCRYKLEKGLIGDISPTALKLMGIKKPKEMKGKNLIIKKLR